MGEAMNDSELRRREMAVAAMDLEGRRRALSIGRDSEETGDRWMDVETGKKGGRGWMQNDHLGFRGWCGRVEDGRWIREHPTAYDARSA